MSDCLFCKIANKELESQVVHETDQTLAFKDINPGAPTHVLVIPKKHVRSAQELDTNDAGLIAELFASIQQVATDAGIDRGYRLVANIGGPAGQTVDHLHFHVLGGRSMSWPPG